jgi:membrane protein DedA with SNARE-associated domain
MATHILSVIANWIISLISTLGYGGVTLLMAIQSANIPIPSEVIMPFAGFLVSEGIMNLWWLVLAGVIGTLFGSIFSYWLGMAGGRPLVEKYGKYLLISHHDLDISDRWFQKRGEIAVFLGRFLPIVRTFISFPAGIAKMDFKKFLLYSFLGSIPWTLALAYLGQKLGQNWETLRNYFAGFDWLILILIVLGIIWWIWRHLRNSRIK